MAGYISCADCPDAYKQEWTHKREALRCGSPERGDAYHYVVQLYLKENSPDNKRPAPAWCPRRNPKNAAPAPSKPRPITAPPERYETATLTAVTMGGKAHKLTERYRVRQGTFDFRTGKVRYE